MNIQGCVPRFLKAHGSLILTILSGLGLVGTVVATANAAPKANDALVVATEEKANEIGKAAWMNGEGTADECMTRAWKSTTLTFWEKVNATAPFYLPVILLGLGTMGCMAGAHILDMKKQAAMTAAYALLEQSFGGYRGEIREKYGAEADKEAYISSQEKIKNLQAEVKRLEKLKGVFSFGIATAPGLIFRASMAQVENAFAHFNRNLHMRGYGDLKELHEFLGLPVNNPMISSPTAPDEEYGWNDYENEITYGMAGVDFYFKDVVANSGEIVKVICFPIIPYRLECEDYDSMNNQYDQYDASRAAELAKYGFYDAPMQCEVDPEHWCYAGQIA